MNIGLNAHLLSGKAGYRSAGIHAVIHNLLRYLPGVLPSDWQLTAMVGADNPLSYDGVTMRRARWNTESPGKRILWEQFVQPWQLGGFDLYHALAFVAPLWLTVPMVVTVYDLTFMRYPEHLSTMRRLYLRLFTGLTCRRARRVIAISHSTARDLVELLGIPADKIDVTPLAYDAEVFKPLSPDQVRAFRRQKNLPERFWLFIGTLEPRKNLPTLIEAYAALPLSERLPLILGGGKGWQVDEIFATIERHGLNDTIHFPGFVPAEELSLWYNSAEAFVYPSVFEGFGLPVLEAMACGTPVITADVSSLPEVAGTAGLCIPPHNVSAWTAALHTASTDAGWREQASETGIEEAKYFTWQETARQTLASYYRALNIESTR
jgi:glycosyltransferase involved in cell wall biosynthesis